MCAFKSLVYEVQEKLREVPVQNGHIENGEVMENDDVVLTTLLVSSSGKSYKLGEKIDDVQKGVGCVRMVYNVNNISRAVDCDKPLAAKVYPLCNIFRSRKGDDFIQEIIIHYKASKMATENFVEGIVPLCECILTENDLILLMPYYNQNDLFYYVTQSTGLLSVSTVKSIFRRLVGGVSLLHMNGFIHRDISCENIYFHSSSDLHSTSSEVNKRVKREANDIFDLGDFGMSCALSETSSLCQTLGKPSYKSPQLNCGKLQSPEDWQSNDVWALGIVLYVLLMKAFPFGQAKCEDGLFVDRIVKCNLAFRATQELSRPIYSAYEKDHDDRIEGLKLVSRILSYKISDRPSAMDIRDDPWLIECPGTLLRNSLCIFDVGCSMLSIASIASMHNQFVLRKEDPQTMCVVDGGTDMQSSSTMSSSAAGGSEPSVSSTYEAA
jgi:serine/threonine protein kinase